MKSHFLRSSISQSYTYNASYGSGTNASSYTWSNSSLGTADSSRLIAVFAFASGTNILSGALPTCTIDGVSATRQVNVFNVANGALCATLFTLPVSSGTTATIVTSYNAIAGRAGIAVYSLYNLHNNENPISTASDSGDELSSTLTLNQRYGSIVLAGSQVFNNLTAPALPTYTWSTSLGDTVTYDAIIRHGTEIRVHSVGSFRARYTGSNNVSLTYDGGVARVHETVGAVFY
jgi:hypothetical protein